jgi:RNA polymerase-interacting CarD/CdnL/TRCF family regulator
MEDEFQLPVVGRSQQQRDEFSLPVVGGKKAEPQDEFSAPVVNLPPSKDEALPPKEVKETQFKDLSKPENLATIRDYATARFGASGAQRKDESDEDYIKRWMTSMRQVEWNTTLNAVPELNWIYNSSQEDAVKAAKAHQLYQSVPDWYEKGGQPGVRPFAEAALSAISEPSNLLSFGIGSAARYAAARTAINKAIESKIKRTAIGTAVAVEAGIGTGESLVQQQIEIETGRRKEISVGEAALSGGIGAVFGGLEARAAFRNVPQTKKELEDILAAKKSPPKADPETEKLVDAFDKEMEDTLTQFDIFEGRKILDEMSPQTELTNAEIRKDINRKAIDVAKYIMLDDPTFRPKEGQKVSDAVKNLFMSVDTIDDAALDAALKRADLTPSEFAQASRTTVADAASVMQGYSSLARTLRRVAEIDPEAQKIVDAMYGKDQDVTSAMGYMMRGIQRLERESKAFVVSSIATTVRNMMGTTGGMTMEAAGRMFEGTLYQTGKAIRSAATGKYERGDLTRGMQDVVKDAFGGLTYLTNAGITAEVVDKLLVDNPRLQSQMFSALQETGNAELSKAARIANTFNVAQDALFRRAIFAASTERQLRAVGMDMYQLMADGKRIPASILQNAADDALKGTFSYMPKPQRAGQVTVEAKAEGLANQFVRFFESMPGGSLLVTFPRFMTNAMAFQYKYSPLGATSGVADMLKSAAIKDPTQSERMFRQGREKFAKGSVGVAAMYAAYKYRLENQNTEWYTVAGEDGSRVDTRAIFPIAPYLAVGDFLAKAKLGTIDGKLVDEYIQTMVGLKVPSGAQGYLVEQIATAFGNAEGKEAEKLEIAVGKVLGDFAGRFIQPGQPVFAYFDMFDREAQVARDPNVIEGDDLVTEAALNRLKAKVPGFKEDLPEAVRYLREETPMRGGEFFNILTGVRVMPKANAIETEFTKLGLEPYTFFGSSGDKTYDREVIYNSHQFVNDFVGELVSSDRYQEMSDKQKKVALAENMSYALQMGRAITQGEMMSSEIERVDKMTFNKLPKRERDAINELYAQEHNGRTMDEDKAYDMVHEYQARLAEFR